MKVLLPSSQPVSALLPLTWAALPGVPPGGLTWRSVSLLQLTEAIRRGLYPQEANFEFLLGVVNRRNANDGTRLRMQQLYIELLRQRQAAERTSADTIEKINRRKEIQRAIAQLESAIQDALAMLNFTGAAALMLVLLALLHVLESIH